MEKQDLINAISGVLCRRPHWDIIKSNHAADMMAADIVNMLQAKGEFHFFTNEVREQDLKSIPPICLTCGVRDNNTGDGGYCQNGHDNWLEERDVRSKNSYFEKALKLTGFTAHKLEQRFMDVNIKQFPISR